MMKALPLPSPDMVAYQAELDAVLKSSERSKENYEKFKRSDRKEELNYSPVKLDIENVSRCNFRCSKCQVSDWKGQKRANDMTLNDFRTIIDHLEGLVEIKLQGMGEPILGGDAFFRMIEYARSRHIWVRTTTNASLLHIRENYKRLIDSDPSEVQISIDGTTKNTFEAIRRGADFETILRNCKLINTYCHSKGLLKTRMWVCLQRQNISEFIDFVPLAHELGFQRLTFALNLHGWGQEKFFLQNSSVAVDNSLTYERTMEAVRLGEKHGLDVSFWDNISKYDAANHKTLCPWPFERAFVSSDMRIVPCCMIANPDVLDLGDAGNFLGNWHGEQYGAFRNAHLEGSIPEACTNCYR